MQAQAGLTGGTYAGHVNPENLYAGSISTATLNPSSLYMMTGGPAAAAPSPTSPATGYTGPFANAMLFNRGFSFYLGIILVLFLIKYAAEHQAINLETSYIHIGILNFVIIALAAKLGDLTLKWLTGIYPVPGLTDIAQA